MSVAGRDQIVPGMRPTEQYHGILIRVLSQTLVKDEETPPEKSISSWRGETTRCWRCRAILSRLGQSHDGTHQNFVLISKRSNCELNHDLLAITRLCLRQIATIPNRLWIESTNQGYLRLVLEQGLQDELKAQLSNNAILSPGRLTEIYDVYQDLKAALTVIPELWVPKGPEIPRSAWNRECLTVARTWLHKCQNEHPQCRVNGMQELPTRVLDVSGESVRLHIPKRGTKGSWVALSYCWGPDRLLRTLNDNMESHKIGIAWRSLPTTHQDAVTITRALGLQYLWIDSLCIIQDDGGFDFHAEAAKMCDVYRHSSLTISAACSTSGSKGFLWERAKSASFGPDPREPARLQYLRCRQAIDHRRMIREEPIHSRAWTFQETILPRRLLSFCSREMTWECETLKQCECWRIHEQSDSGETYDDMGRAAYRRYIKSIMLDGCSAGKRFEIQDSHARTELPNPNGQGEFSDQVEEVRSKQLLIQFFSTTLLAGTNLGAYRRYLQSLRQVRLERVASLEHRSKRPRLESWTSTPEPWCIFSQYFDAFARDEMESALQDAIDGKSKWNNTQLLIATNEDLRMYMANLERKHVDRPELEAFYRYWRQTLVPEYTRRCISKDEDRLVGLQAVAGDIHSRIRDQYCAGLWRQDLVRQLCWKSQTEENTPAENQRPSWAWSSIRGPVIPCLDAHIEGTNQGSIEAPGDMEVEEVTCNTLDSNPCGQILGGCIKLYAWALRVRAVRNRETGRIEFFQRKFQWKEGILEPIRPRLQFFPDTPLKSGTGQPLLRYKGNDCDHGTDYAPNAGNDKLLEPGAQALLLLVQENNRCVLVCSPTVKARVFRRVGIGLYPSNDGLNKHSLDGHFIAGMHLSHLELI